LPSFAVVEIGHLAGSGHEGNGILVKRRADPVIADVVDFHVRCNQFRRDQISGDTAGIQLKSLSLGFMHMVIDRRNSGHGCSLLAEIGIDRLAARGGASVRQTGYYLASWL